MRALVAFHGRGHMWWNRWCRAGFKHCFIALDDGRFWITIDGRAGVPEIRVAASSAFDLAAFWREQGLVVLATEARPDPISPLVLATCVGTIKRLTGIRAPWIFTPYRLFKHLSSDNRYTTRTTPQSPQGD